MVLNPHGSDETNQAKSVKKSLTDVLNPHGSDETLVKTPTNSSPKPVLNPHGSDETGNRKKPATDEYSS